MNPKNMKASVSLLSRDRPGIGLMASVTQPKSAGFEQSNSRGILS